MSPPKPPKPPPPTGLHEVERALSVLGGRHPEHERIKRETAAAAEKRRVAIEAELAESARRRRRRAVVVTVNLIALGAAGFVGWRLFARSSRLRDALASAEAPFLARGMEELSSNILTGRSTLETDVPAASCFVAVTTAGTLRVQLGATTTSAPRSVGWCGCANGRVTVDATGADDSTAGIAILRVDDKTFGGALARTWVPVRPDAWADVGAECAEDALDGWLAGKHFTAPPLTEHELDAVAGASTLRASGLRVVTKLADGAPFGLVEGGAAECHIALGARDELTLRMSGGARPIERAPGVLAWCASLPETVTLWRTSGAAPVVVLSAPAARLGGLLGARECLHDAGDDLAPTAGYVKPDDLGWEATTILTASALGEIVTAALPTEAGARDARVTSLVYARGAKVTWDPSLAVATCDPPLETGAALGEAVCALSAPACPWRANDVAAVSARAPLPLWMSTLAKRTEPDAIAHIPELLTLTRRMTREGFVPTVLEGVTELPEGVRIVGRAAEDAVVAVGVAPRAPWVYPYTDQIPWDLGDAPREIPLEPGKAVLLHATPPPAVPVDKRRTVVFRRSTRL